MNSHPYKDFENTLEWKLIEKAINVLYKNNDLGIKTRKEYIVGYIVKTLLGKEK